MKLGVLTVPFSAQPLEEVLPYLKSLGVQAVELGTGGYTNKAHCDPAVYLNHPDKIEEMKELLNKNGMFISALSCHANPVHPNQKQRDEARKNFEDTVALANQLGVNTVVTFSGCPGDCDASQYPNWVTCPWPDDYLKILDYQWNEKLIPYWKDAAKIAKDGGVKVALEMHPGFCVYNTQTMLRLREATDPVIGANYDPSHLFWQGIDPISSIRELGSAIHYVHAKDCRIDALNTGRTGVLDTKPYSDELHRSWLFRTVGYGHDAQTWKDLISALRMVGYDGVVSIEHEDSLMSIHEGMEKAVAFMQQVMINEKPAAMWWA